MSCKYGLRGLRRGSEAVSSRQEVRPRGVERQPVEVKPDIAVLLEPPVILDAKYRTRTGRLPTIGSDDLYEALAFEIATESKQTLLLYPRTADAGAVAPPGTVERFGYVEVEDRTVTGATVEVRGIGGLGGFARFTANLVEGVKAVFPELVAGLPISP